MDDLILDRLKDSLHDAEAVKRRLELVYVANENKLWFKKPAMNMMLTGVDFLIQNLKVMLVQYEAKTVVK